MNLPNQARATLATGQPVNFNLGRSPDDFDIQWMPPGPQSPCCFVAGEAKTLTFTVKPQHAAAFNAMLQQMRTKAATGSGDEPYIDFNHEDGRASGRPTEIYWAGNDPAKGGIRLKGKWTPSGKVAVQGKEYARFSPEWFFDDKQEPSAIGANLGGLVNKAAFTHIQPVKARAAQLTPQTQLEAAVAAAMAPMLKILVSKIEDLESENVRAGVATAKAAPHSFRAMVESRRLEKGISKEQALAEIQNENPTAALAYASTPKVGAHNYALPLNQDHPFLKQAKQMADTLGISMEDAQIRVATQNHPAYQQYLRSLQRHGANQETGETASAKAKAINDLQGGLLQLVRAKQAAGLAFDDALRQAQLERPDLLNLYRTSFR